MENGNKAHGWQTDNASHRADIQKRNWEEGRYNKKITKHLNLFKNI